MPCTNGPETPVSQSFSGGHRLAFAVKAEVNVHTVPRRIGRGLRNETGMEAKLPGAIADRFLCQHHAVGSGDGIGGDGRNLELVSSIFRLELLQPDAGFCQRAHHMGREVRDGAAGGHRVGGMGHLVQPLDRELMLEGNLHGEPGFGLRRSTADLSTLRGQ